MWFMPSSVAWRRARAFFTPLIRIRTYNGKHKVFPNRKQKTRPLCCYLACKLRTKHFPESKNTIKHFRILGRVLDSWSVLSLSAMVCSGSFFTPPPEPPGEQIQSSNSVETCISIHVQRYWAQKKTWIFQLAFCTTGLPRHLPMGKSALKVTCPARKSILDFQMGIFFELWIVEGFIRFLSSLYLKKQHLTFYLSLKLIICPLPLEHPSPWPHPP